jgi:hypothetical protein
MMLAWLNSKDVEAFGKELALFFAKKFPANSKKEITAAKRKEVIAKMLYKVDQFKLKNKLNFYKKAKFGNAFQWTLKDIGYTDELIGELTKELLLRLG